MTTEDKEFVGFKDGTVDHRGIEIQKTVPYMLVEDRDPRGKGWNKVQGEPCRVKEIEGFIYLLEEPAQRLYSTRQASTIIDFDRFYPTKTEAHREWAACQYLCKPVVLDKVGEVLSVPNQAVVWLADALNLLVRNDMVAHGVLAPAMWLNLMKIGDGDRGLVMLYTYPSFKVQEMAEKERGDNSDFDLIEAERQILNIFLQNEAFAIEGEMGDDEWSDLPK